MFPPLLLMRPHSSAVCILHVWLRLILYWGWFYHYDIYQDINILLSYFCTLVQLDIIYLYQHEDTCHLNSILISLLSEKINNLAIYLTSLLFFVGPACTIPNLLTAGKLSDLPLIHNIIVIQLYVEFL